MVEFAKDTNIAYTRYLYNYTEVRQSLFISMLNYNIDESLYWAYELYYSGYKVETCEFILDTYLLIYRDDNNEYENKIINDINILKEEDNAIMYGNIIATLCTLQYDLQKFCKKYLKIDVKQIKIKKNNMLVELNDEYIKEFETVNIREKSYRVLRNVIKYPIRNDYNLIFNTLLPSYENLYKMMYYHWLYYASKNPVWYERICEHNGVVDNDKKTVEFEDDDDIEEFHEKWGYDIEEQPVEIQHSIVGKKDVIQIGIKDFCKIYMLQLKTKKIVQPNISISISDT